MTSRRATALLALFSAFCVVSIGCGDSSLPEGEPTKGVFGPAGGELASSDGQLVLRIPEGALAGETELEITPIANDNPHGLGLAYRLSPEGHTFEVPVTLSFRLEPAVTGDASPAGLGVAYRTGTEGWTAPTERTVDEAGGQLTVGTTHFSVWSLFELFRLSPQRADVRTGAAQTLQVETCVQWEDSETQLVALVPTCTALPSGSGLGAWAVNGAAGGSAQSGLLQAQGAQATYTAPGSVPGQNPVSVTVEVGLPGKAKGLLVSHCG